tara:strand:- start:476 stop:772 length:297 start_codon:yes stop_codon:yes gene_type:complete
MYRLFDWCMTSLGDTPFSSEKSAEARGSHATDLLKHCKQPGSSQSREFVGEQYGHPDRLETIADGLAFHVCMQTLQSQLTCCFEPLNTNRAGCVFFEE